MDQFNSPQMSALLAMLTPLTPTASPAASRAASRAASPAVSVHCTPGGQGTAAGQQTAAAATVWSTIDGVVVSPFNTPQLSALLASLPPLTPASSGIGLLTPSSEVSSDQGNLCSRSSSLVHQMASPRQSGSSRQERVAGPSRLGKRGAADAELQVCDWHIYCTLPFHHTLVSSP